MSLVVHLPTSGLTDDAVSGKSLKGTFCTNALCEIGCGQLCNYIPVGLFSCSFLLFNYSLLHCWCSQEYLQQNLPERISVSVSPREYNPKGFVNKVQNIEIQKLTFQQKSTWIAILPGEES